MFIDYVPCSVQKMQMVVSSYLIPHRTLCELCLKKSYFIAMNKAKCVWIFEKIIGHQYWTSLLSSFFIFLAYMTNAEYI